MTKRYAAGLWGFWDRSSARNSSVRPSWRGAFFAGDVAKAQHIGTVEGLYCADTDEAGHAFQYEAGHRYRFEAGRGSDLMSATWRVLPRIEVMMFGLAGLVKPGWIWASVI
jgi:hypothetical protein